MTERRVKIISKYKSCAATPAMGVQPQGYVIRHWMRMRCVLAKLQRAGNKHARDRETLRVWHTQVQGS